MADDPDEIRARGADGSVHRFPKGTDPSVVDKVMKQYALSKKTRLGELGETVTDIPGQIYEAYARPARAIGEFGEWARGPGQASLFSREGLSSIPEGLRKGASALGSAMYLGTGVGPAIEGGLRSVLGHGAGATLGPEATEPTMEGVSESLGMIAHVPGATPTVPAVAPRRRYPFGIITPEGPIPSGKLSPAANARKLAYEAQQAKQLDKARTETVKKLEPGRKKIIAGTPGEAGQIIQSGEQGRGGLLREFNRVTAETKQAYDEAKAAGGEVHAGVFEGIGQRIKADLTVGPDQVIIDNRTTPIASAAAACSRARARAEAAGRCRRR